MTDLGTLGGAAFSAAAGINPAGQVVGTSFDFTNVVGEYHAFLWAKGLMIELGTLGGTSSLAQDINSSGVVVGTSQTVAGEFHATHWARQ